MTIKNTIRKAALTALVAGAALLPGESQAQTAQDTLPTTTITTGTEMGATYNSPAKIGFLRVNGSYVTPNHSLTITHDINPEKDDVLNVGLNKTLGRGWGLGSAIYRLGDAESDSEYLVEAFATIDKGEIGGMLDIGRSIQGPQDDLKWVIGSLSYRQARTQGGILNNEDTGENKLYGNISVGNDNAYASIGHAAGKNVAIGMLAGDDIANLTFGNHTPETGQWSVRSQTGIGEPNRGFYSSKLANIATQYLTIPPFQPLHFSPFMTKGDWSVLVSGHGDEDKSHWETLVGKNLGPMMVGAGISHTTDSGTTSIGLPLQVYVPITIGPIQAGIEAAMDATTGDGSAYLTAKYTLTR